MRMYDIIQKKRDGKELTREEINFFIDGYTKGDIPDYQMSALLMAIYLKKMTKQETVNLTNAMVNSGEKVDLSSIKGIKVDKHSTGGVGDKTTLALGPMVAACGLPVVKMSGRGLGHTGGTLDKLDSIRGFNTDISKDNFVKIVNNINICIGGQTTNIAPADKKIYSLRDVTATVDDISLIASSVMSKKIASGADAIVLDVKVGSGAFMKDEESAFELAQEMVDIGENVGRRSVAIVTNMDEPLGYSVGNSLEVKEAIDILKNEGPKDLLELCLTLGSYMLLLGQKVSSFDEGKKKLIEVLENGKALEKLKELVKLQDGDISYIEDTSKLPMASHVLAVTSDKEGYIEKINAEQIGKCALELGAGRETKESKIDLSAGIVLSKKVNDKINKGETLAFIHSNDIEKAEKVIKKLKDIIKISDKEITNKKLIYGVIDKNKKILY
ncbi:pyrimidine-nucleoside phosphorylase Pdp [Gottschalkia acidurici 9a]|uniref:Pyrimidine-nucleoside phosphorylase n=1 Tax=Gottschalkia acidurici (strain ATCC 7906 / DSM 604 / BCRC 14475 / CIP 104303 / KCTC 5404 / NCIMB 10678 / 9a) TaxID=1128398 RepID=K0B1A5_GOTA9|nr:pyrimidine-nucleoside phosphorylase [Gottschalkia acidurici]AFS78416.1 pyrimidine-nucleoside phosphorylase Pdp [Gottschalkia acidurici 9a]